MWVVSLCRFACRLAWSDLRPERTAVLWWTRFPQRTIIHTPIWSMFKVFEYHDILFKTRYTFLNSLPLLKVLAQMQTNSNNQQKFAVRKKGTLELRCHFKNMWKQNSIHMKATDVQKCYKWCKHYMLFSPPFVKNCSIFCDKKCFYILYQPAHECYHS